MNRAAHQGYFQRREYEPDMMLYHIIFSPRKKELASKIEKIRKAVCSETLAKIQRSPLWRPNALFGNWHSAINCPTKHSITTETL
jgi:hypothetical protein